MKTNKLKLNYYYVPVKQRYKLTNIKSVEPVIPVATDNDFLIDLLFNTWTTRALWCGETEEDKII